MSDWNADLPRPPRFHDADMRLLDTATDTSKPTRADRIIASAFLAGAVAFAFMAGFGVARRISRGIL